MNGKMLFETSKRRGTTLKSYASRVFQESAVGMVSSLAQTSSTPRRIFKAFVLIFCLTGFLYQSAKFLTVVFQYPTVVDIDILRPNTFNIPAYSFCDNNGLKRSLFCEKYPKYCEQADEKLCKKYEGYCGPNRTQVPKREYYTKKYSMPSEEIVQLNENLSDFLLKNRNEYDEEVTGPHMRMKHRDDPNMMMCYSLNDRVVGSKYPLKAAKKNLMRLPVNELQFNVKADEILIPGTRPGIVFAIHSPFEAVNPFEKGIFLKPGRTYMIYVSMEEEVLLKKPYETDCINYTEQWETNGHSGPRMQEMCKEKCYLEISMACYRCALELLLYPTNERICTDDEEEQMNCTDIPERLERCELRCKDDCQRTKYHYQVQERYSVKFDYDGEIIEDLDRQIFVEVYLEEDEIIVLKHSPKYMIVEMFSTIGGFVGGWLGISLLDVSDIFEGFFRIIRYSFKRR